MVWSRLGHAITLAHGGHAEVFVPEAMSWADEMPLVAQQRAGLYVYALLNFQIQQILRRKPTAPDLQILARQIERPFTRILDRASSRQIEETPRRAFEMRPLDRQPAGGEFLLFGITVLGILLDDPNEQLQRIRPHIAEWWPRSQDRFPEQARSPPPASHAPPEPA
jgi:hypothetical protein